MFKHRDDIAIENFSIEMKKKMKKSRKEKGRYGWDSKDVCSDEHLSNLLISHIEKGDPIDVANFAMMLHQRGSKIIIKR